MANIEVIKNRIAELEKLQDELKVSKEMLDGELENESTYLEAKEEVKSAQMKLKQVKDEILATGPNQKIIEQMKENREEISALKEILNAELFGYSRESGSYEITDNTGHVRRIEIKAKLVKTNQPNLFEGAE